MVLRLSGRELTSPRALLVTHFFNHQTHHRGQVHAQLTGFGIKPGITDLPFGPDALRELRQSARFSRQARAQRCFIERILATSQ